MNLPVTKLASADGTVGKALNVLDEIASLKRPVRFVELQASSQYPKATLYRLVQTLTSQGMLSYDPERRVYSLGVRLVRLAHAAWRQSSLAPVARPVIDALSSKVGETVHLAQLDGGQVLYVDKRNAASPIEMYSEAGKIAPGYCTGVGKVMLAFLEPRQRARALSQQAYHRYTKHTLTCAEDLEAELAQIRSSGIAFDREEHEQHIICIAAPILASSGRVIGGLSITSSTLRHHMADLEKYKPDLIKAAEQIGKVADSWRFPDQKS